METHLVPGARFVDPKVLARVKDLDLEQRSITVRNCKGGKDRVTILPDQLIPALREHLRALNAWYLRERQVEAPGVSIPDALKRKYPALVLPQGGEQAFATPPADPSRCTFARVSTNVSADLTTRIEPCFFGGNPDCSECGCAVSAGLHWVHNQRVAGVTVGRLIDVSLAVGRHPRRRVSPIVASL